MVSVCVTKVTLEMTVALKLCSAPLRREITASVWLLMELSSVNLGGTGLPNALLQTGLHALACRPVGDMASAALVVYVSATFHMMAPTVIFAHLIVQTAASMACAAPAAASVPWAGRAQLATRNLPTAFRPKL